MRVLIVDDDDFAAAMTAAVLEDGGHEAVIVDGGVAAVETLAADPAFDAVISDMNMPLISGLELFETLREGGCVLPFILLSGDDPQVLQRREPRLDACIAKDGNLEQSLASALANLCSVRS